MPKANFVFEPVSALELIHGLRTETGGCCSYQTSVDVMVGDGLVELEFGEDLALSLTPAEARMLALRLIEEATQEDGGLDGGEEEIAYHELRRTAQAHIRAKGALAMHTAWFGEDRDRLTDEQKAERDRLTERVESTRPKPKLADV